MSTPAPSLLQFCPPPGQSHRDRLRELIFSVEDRLDRKCDEESKKDEEAGTSLGQVTTAPLFFESILPFKPSLMHVRCHCSRAVLVSRKHQLYQRIGREEIGCGNGEKHDNGKRYPRCEEQIAIGRASGAPSAVSSIPSVAP